MQRRTIRGAAALGCALAALVATSASSAAAAPAAATAWECETFDALTALTTAGALAARGGDDVVKEPTLSQTSEALPASAKGKGGPRFRDTVPVWFHVVSPDGVTGQLTRQQIDDQMRVLNMTFGGFEGGARSGFTFELAGVTRTTDAAWYGSAPPAEHEMKRSLRRGGWETLNVYSTSGYLYLGWAYLPGLPESQLWLDGIVIDWRTVPGASTAYAGRYDLGETLTHEAGHWLGLEHTFSGGCNANGDHVDDTPAMKVPTGGCPEGKDTCVREPGLDPIHNYMDYSYDSCYTEFTPGQAARMQDHWLHFRA